MSRNFEIATIKPNHEMAEHHYGKSGVKVLHVVRNGLVYSVKEFEVTTFLTLSSQKDYLKGDNSDIIATDSQKNTVYILAKKYGVKSPEDFAILLSKHFLSTYNHVTKVAVGVEELTWNRITYDDRGDSQKQHNHAFIHVPSCKRFTNVTLQRGEKSATVVSGMKDMRLLKTTQSSFVNFVDDAYRTLPDASDRIFSTVVNCSWEYSKDCQVDYDKGWDLVKNCILYNFAGDLGRGVPSPSVQHTLYLAEKEVLEKVGDIKSIEMTLPNKHYVNFDFGKFKDLVKISGEETVFLPLDKPSGIIYLKLSRKVNKL
ncbi:CLUMA_CG006916, isoform A [Clunio marinus]|uniref:Uricase n=1 Tax=Clunio marinus TaxID=568069 RepID=A0A1J1I1B1_9DIPT|nr:CLUMA_CG006916, isoform A [Clunio marinus]